MKIYLIRHGESINNIFEATDPEGYYYLRVADPELTDLGKQQALKLRSALASLHFDRISPMYRCLQTAKIALDDRSTPIEVIPNLYEYGGMWNLQEAFTGFGQQEILSLFPNFDASRVRPEGYYFLDHMENAAESKIRMLEILEELKALENNSVCIVAHGLLLKAMLEYILKSLPEAHEHIRNREFISLNNCSVSILEVKNNQVQILAINRSDNI